MVRHIHGILQELRALTAAMRQEESRRHWGTVRKGCTIRPYTHNTTMDGRVVVVVGGITLHTNREIKTLKDTDS